TNHHCGYDAIATHSSEEHDYLTDGFWARSYAEELPNEGLTVSFLVRIEDVTKKIDAAVAKAEEGQEEMAIQAAIGTIEAEATEGNDYRAQVKPMFDGNEHLLFIYEVYRDVRLVGAPPSSIGKFGGDTDNWMWPRHTGDFSVLRVYADKDNNPADYSEDNVPYKPKHYLPISIKGFKQGDFAMTLGYPGNTDRYLSSYAIEHAYKYDNPTIVKLLGERLDIMHKDMMASDKVRIGMASSYASLANTHKYFIGQNRGLTSRGLIEERQEFEKGFQKWATSDTKRKEKYGDVLNQFKENYASSREVLKLRMYMNFAGFGPQFMQSTGISAWRLKTMMGKEDADPESYAPMVERMKAGLDDAFEGYFGKTDQKVTAAMVRAMYKDLPEKFHPSIFSSKGFSKAKAKGGKDRFDAYAAKMFATSILTNKARQKAFLAKPSLKVLTKDMGVQYVESIINLYRNQLAMGNAMFEAVNGEAMKVYQAGMHEMMPNKKFYPDANSTMRMSYGTVLPYDPRDGVSYKTQTFAKGVLEKEKPGDEEFNVEPKLHDLFTAKDFGRYAQDGKLPLCFLTNNDITGGNSGSPVINGEGQLIGIAFDGNWESMTSDLVWDDDIVRTISVDIRYVLFVIEKYAGATNLIKELKIIE
ncbi:MAG TPA: S46 family peptidase, partial [Bacteroidetes bacterium]|nr:S46 family peptidase [Bacteroidota bacterium]